jgi:hypothetical protein
MKFMKFNNIPKTWSNNKVRLRVLQLIKYNKIILKFLKI